MTSYCGFENAEYWPRPVCVADMFLDAASALFLFLRVPLLLLGIVVFLAYLWVLKERRTYDYERVLKLPGPPPMPLIGNLNLFVGKSLPELKRLYEGEYIARI